MKDYESLTCLEIKEILKKHNVTGYSKLCKQELVNLVKKTLNKKKIKKGGLKNGENFHDKLPMNKYSNLVRKNNKHGLKELFNSEAKPILEYISTFMDESGNLLPILEKMITLTPDSDEYQQLDSKLLKILKNNKKNNKKNHELIKLIEELLTKHSNSEERLTLP